MASIVRREGDTDQNPLPTLADLFPHYHRMLAKQWYIHLNGVHLKLFDGLASIALRVIDRSFYLSAGIRPNLMGMAKLNTVDLGEY